MSTLVYVHGTNGSGKSTLARAVLAAAGGATGVGCVHGYPKATWTLTPQCSVSFLGKYKTSCGGVDGISPYSLVHQVLEDQAAKQMDVFAEGLLTPGLETCQRFAKLYTKAVFIHLDTPEDQCIRNLLPRRAAAGNDKPYDPTHLYLKTKAARRWALRLRGGGLDVRTLQWPQAYVETLALLRIPTPDPSTLLGTT